MAQLRSDQRGAMMLIGLFFAVFGVGILYSAVGVSQAALFRQHMQDGADAAALSGAVMQARSMNLIVLLNIVMAALLSVLVALKLVEAIAIAGIVIAGIVATPTYGGSLALVPPLETIRDKVKTIHDNLEEPISEALEAINFLADTVSDLAPEIAGAVAQGTRSAPVERVYVGVGATLPVEDDEFKRLCQEAGEFPIELAAETLPLPKSGVLEEFVTDPLASAMGKLSSTFSKWFCGDSGDGSSSPSEEISDFFWYPMTDSTELCGEPPIPDGVELQPDEIEALTKEYADECHANGERAYAEGCDPHGPCTLSEPYAAQAELARETCQPGEGFAFYAYQQRTGTVPYTWTGMGWQRGTPSMDPPLKVEEQLLVSPCGTESSVSESYNITVHADESSDVVTPLCSNESYPGANGRRQVGEVEVVAFTEVIHMMGCARRETIPVEIDSEQADGGEDKSPKRVVAELEQGSEEFQIRSIAVGSPSYSSASAAVRLSLWGREAGDDGLGHLRSLGGYSAAQAEFFYDGSGGSGDWMWNMQWRARITRFRASEEQLGPLYDECQTLGDLAQDTVGVEGLVAQGGCTMFLDELARLGVRVTH